MRARNQCPGFINKVNPLLLFAVLCLLTIILPRPCTADYCNHNGSFVKVAANRIIVATNPSAPQAQGLDPETLEVLKARKAALDQERTQIENELRGIFRVGIQQQDPGAKRTKRAICKVNEDLEAMTKRLAAHQQKREAFERNWDQYYVTLQDSAEVKSLKKRKRVLDWDRTQIEEELLELVRRHGQQTDQEKEIQWYQVALREIDERLVGYQQTRNAFERDWEAFYTNR